MASITLRSAKGSALTNAEVDANFSNINTELVSKLPLAGGTLTGEVTFGGGINFGSSGTGRIVANWSSDTSTRSYFAGRNAGNTDWRWDAEFGWDGANQRWYFDQAPFIAGNAALHAGNYNSYAPTLVGIGASGSWGISVTGNAATATALQTARNINGVSFNGSANVTVTTAGTGISVSGTAVSLAAAYSPDTATELPSSQDLNTYQTAGFYYQTSNADTTGGSNYPASLAGSMLVQKSAGVTQQYQTYDTNSAEMYFRSLYLGTWGAWRRVLTNTNFNTYAPTLTGTGASGSWGISVTGSAATLATTRAINGTNFNGSAAITTASWGTARTLTVGATGKSVNGSANVSWTTEEILPARLRAYAASISDWNTITENGWYQGSGTTNAPNADWHIGFVEVHNNDWVTQTVHGFSNDDASDAKLWRRHKNAGTWLSWYRLRWTEAEQDARYAQVNGTGASGTWSINVTGNAATVTNGLYGNSDQTITTGFKRFQATDTSIANASGNLSPLEVKGAGGSTGAAFMTFHRPGYWAAYFGIDTDNVWKVGGWSMGAVAYPILHSNNFNTYALPLTGGALTGNLTVTGNVGIGGAIDADASVRVSKNIAGGTFAAGVRSSGVVQTAVTGRADYFQTVVSTAVGATYPAVNGYQAQQGTLAGTVTTQAGFNADASLIGATNNYGFRGQIAAGSGRYNLYMDGSAENHLAGTLLIGQTSNANSSKVVVNGTVEATAIRLPTGGLLQAVQGQSAQITTSEALVAGDLVNVHNVGGAFRVRKASAASAGLEAHAYVLAAVASGAAATVFFDGLDTMVSGLTPGPRYLSTTPGLTTTTAPSTTGQVVQRVGFGVSATSLRFNPGDPITLA